MKIEYVDLYEYYKFARNGAQGGFITVYARTEGKEVKKRIRPAILVIPGGGYDMLSDREGEPVALKYLDAGFVSFVLSYSLKTQYPVPLNEAMLAMAYIRDNAEKYSIDKNKVCVVGFSAGGHLCGLLSTAKSDEIAALNLTAERAKPNIAILSYPVVTMGEFTHLGTRLNITGDDKSIYDKLSVDKRADKNSAPVFIWHTYEDGAVSVENSLLLASAYRKQGIPFTLHIFEKGWHGLSLADSETCDFKADEQHLYDVGKWFSLSIDWLKARDFEVKINE